MKKINKMDVVNEARKYGDSFVGDVNFDVIKDRNSWHRFFQQNDISDCRLVHIDRPERHLHGWFVICQ